MMTRTSSNHATVKERPVTTLDQKPASSEGRKDQWSQMLQKVGKNQDREAYHALFE
ncbi:MAG TPA: RNA polymerase subunit sigma-24, partial [Marinobacter adhaerens]|nr:RNA polymerase subunit sigma-24 [Marinobacter adhaerens]